MQRNGESRMSLLRLLPSGQNDHLAISVTKMKNREHCLRFLLKHHFDALAVYVTVSVTVVGKW